MKSIKNVLALLMAVAVLTGALVGCGGSGGQQQVDWDGTPQYGGHLNVRTTSRMTGVDPLKQTGTWNYQWTSSVYEPFLTRDNDNNIQPCVCDFIMSEDYLDLQLWPREGYTFSHGYGQVELEDIEASFNRGLALYANIITYVKPYVKSAQIETIDGKEVFHIQFSEYNEKVLWYFATYRTWWPVMPKEICDKYSNGFIVNELEDAVGTGPYTITDFKDSVQVTLTKRDDYTPVDNSQYSGFAGTKYGYMDSMTFWYNATDANAAMAVLSGDYDVTEVIPSDYAQMAADAGLVCTKLPSNQRCFVYFNTKGADNLTAKYPSLRKAIMAAIDYTTFLDVVTDSAMIMDTDTICLDPAYDLTQKWKDADYYGDADQAVVDKYMEQAKAEGYNGEPIELVYHTGRTDIPTMFKNALDDAGIEYKYTAMEMTAYNSFVSDSSKNWDCYFTWGVCDFTPGLLQDSIVYNNYKSERVEQIRKAMWKLDPNSEEYMALWDEWSTLWVEECQVGYMSAIDWWWWHPATLHINDDGENGNIARHFYNAFWEDPVNHEA